MDHVVHSLEPAGSGLNEDRYPFLWELQAPLSSSLTPYLGCSEQQAVYDLPDAVFARLYYRSLLLVFRDFLLLSQRLLFVRQTSNCPPWIQCPPESTVGWGYYLSRQDETLTLALVRAHPLNGASEAWPPITGQECRAFHRHIAGPQDSGACVANVPSPGMPRTSYTRLIRHFINQHPNLRPIESRPGVETGFHRYSKRWQKDRIRP